MRVPGTPPSGSAVIDDSEAGGRWDEPLDSVSTVTWFDWRCHTQREQGVLRWIVEGGEGPHWTPDSTASEA